MLLAEPEIPVSYCLDSVRVVRDADAGAGLCECQFRRAVQSDG
jgi:hypothetical protein